MVRDRCDLRPAQVRLIDEMKAYMDGIMVLGMGAGKTASALTAFSEMQKDHMLDRMIVAAPARVVENVWPKEPAKWHQLKHLDVKACVGRPKQRTQIMNSTWDVLVVSIENLPWLLDNVDDSIANDRTLFVIDEMSKFKNPTGVRGKRLLKHRDRFAGVWGLTGTPRPNGYGDLFMPLKIVGGEDIWGIRSYTEWQRANFRMLDFHGYNWKVHKFAIPGLEAVAREFMAYAPSDDLVKPKLNTGPEFVRHVQLTDEQRLHYKAMEKDLIVELSEEQFIQAMSRGAGSMKLTQIAQGFMYHETGETHTFNVNPKLDMLKEMDEELNNDNAVITYGFRAEIPVLKELFKHRSIGVLGGGVSNAQANKTIDRWNRGEIDRLLLHPASAGHGIELQFGGHHMIHYHPLWSPELYDQVVKRLDRPGQKHEVFNWWIVADNTVDDMKYARVEEKLNDEELFRRGLRLLTDTKM